uniref:Uncharacterized protein n=1 Tax=Scophthalmus maximus TaxID=52904 RepID=A0A8D2ZP62_SCOMX
MHRAFSFPVTVERSRTKERLEASLAGLCELELRKQRQECLVLGALALGEPLARGSCRGELACFSSWGQENLTLRRQLVRSSRRVPRFLFCFIPYVWIPNCLLPPPLCARTPPLHPLAALTRSSEYLMAPRSARPHCDPLDRCVDSRVCGCAFCPEVTPLPLSARQKEKVTQLD